MAKRPKPQDRTPADLLSSLAAALNDCEKGGVKIRQHHGSLICDFGVVLPPEKKDRKDGWVARTFGMLPQSPGREGG